MGYNLKLYNYILRQVSVVYYICIGYEQRHGQCFEDSCTIFIKKGITYCKSGVFFPRQTKLG